MGLAPNRLCQIGLLHGISVPEPEVTVLAVDLLDARQPEPMDGW